MAINCFTDFITLDLNCEATTPLSGFRVTDLAEVKFLTFEKMTDADNNGVGDLWGSIYARAVALFEADIRRRMQSKMSRRTAIDNAYTGRYKDTWVQTTAAANYRGALVKVSGSPFIELHVQSIRFYSYSAGAQDFLIYDAQTGDLLDTISATLTTGHNVVQVNQTYATGGRNTEIFICYDATSTTSGETWVGNWTDSCECSCADPSGVMRIRGAQVDTGDSVIEPNMSVSNDTFGLIAVVSAVCGVGSFICANRDLFAVPFLYWCAIQTVEELKNTERINDFTLHRGLDRATVALRGDGDLDPGLYGKYSEIIEATLEDIKIASDGVCFDCLTLAETISTV